MNNIELRAMWREAGGSFHGPQVETGTMPESKLLPFLQNLILAERQRFAEQCTAYAVKLRSTAPNNMPTPVEVANDLRDLAMGLPDEATSVHRQRTR